VIQMCKPNRTDYILFSPNETALLNTFQLVSYSILPATDNRLVR